LYGEVLLIVGPYNPFKRAYKKYIKVNKYPSLIKEELSMTELPPDIIVQNMVATTNIGNELDLEKMAQVLVEAEYDRQRFPGLIFHIDDPKTAVLLFRTGNVTCTGAKNVDMIQKAISIVVEKISEADFEVNKDFEIIVQNIVATTDLKADLNLTNLAMSLNLEKVEYEPEVFPGLVYRNPVPKAVMLLFSSGKMVCTGAKKLGDVRDAIECVRQELRKCNFL